MNFLLCYVGLAGIEDISKLSGIPKFFVVGLIKLIKYLLKNYIYIYIYIYLKEN